MPIQKFSFGWIPDYPDIRNYSDTHEKIKPIVSRLAAARDEAIPKKVDLRQWCSGVENQGKIGSCTANSVAGIVEYFENKAFGKHIEVSRLFLYKVSRNLLHTEGDKGAFLKTAIGALTLFGVPPEEYWPYVENSFDDEPNAFCYSFAQNYKCINYFSHSANGAKPEEVLQSVKKYLASGIPSVFGFTVYSSIEAATKVGCIPFPNEKEKFLGGHAVGAYGYDDKKKIENPYTGESTTGALLIRNSWGEEWGDKGYGWLPYEFVLRGLALDFWSLVKQEWVDAEAFFSK
ncbi:MAG: C1 family peptidase [Bacillota bacterium]|nr:C1 family peptidase [Bacillota bacterium]